MIYFSYPVGAGLAKGAAIGAFSAMAGNYFTQAGNAAFFGDEISVKQTLIVGGIGGISGGIIGHLTLPKGTIKLEFDKTVNPKTISEFASEYKISGSQKVIYSSGVKKYYDQMVNGSFDPLLKQNTIGGFTRNGSYIIGEGHHRVAAAIKFGMKSGDYSFLQKLMNNARWTPYSKHGISSIPFPTIWK